MAKISTYICCIVSIVIAASFINMIIPNGEIKKYVRFCVGLIVICCFANLLVGFKGIDIGEISYNTKGEYNEQVFTNQLKSIYTSKLEQEVKRKFHVNDVKITVGDDMKIKCIKTSNADMKRKIEIYLGVE